MLIALAAVAASVTLLLFLAWLLQRRFIYFPVREPPPSAAALFPRGEDVHFTTEDGLTLGAWYVRPSGVSAGATVIVLGGNGGHREYRVDLVRAFAVAGFAVLMVDYRGYGDNPGDPDEAGLLADARAARAYLLTRSEVEATRLAYFGESLGAAIAVALAVEHPPAAVVLRSPFSSLEAVARVHYPFLPGRWLLRDRFPAAEQIARIAAPTLVIAGERDRIVPPEQSREVFEAAAGPKTWLLVPGADHNDLALAAGEAMLARVCAFLRDAVGRPP
ncbi:MAG: alpha/beta hydrolase [Actinobacteria bacterium]|nr:alpha/beta hydrolase [Actinomycetota bacterium]